MKKIFAIFAVAVFSLLGGKAFAQRCLPGMSAVEIKANMADGFYTGKSRDCGYDLGVIYSVFTGSHGNTWSFGGEYLQTFKRKVASRWLNSLARLDIISISSATTR